MDTLTAYLAPVSNEERAERETTASDVMRLVRAAKAAAYERYWMKRQPRPSIAAVARTLGAWSPEDRRAAALRIHLGDIRSRDAPDPLASIEMQLVFDGSGGWSPTDLRWSLHLLEEGRYSYYGTECRLPGMIAATLTPAELAEFVPAFTALLADVAVSQVFVDSRREVIGLIGAVLDRAVPGPVSSRFLHPGDRFGPHVRAAHADALAAPGFNAVLAHCDVLEKPVPSAKWLLDADALIGAGFGCAESVATIVSCFAKQHDYLHDDYLHDDADRLLRGLACVLGLDESDAATELLARLAVAAGSAGTRSAGYPYAPRTAIAVVGILADRAGDAPARALGRLSLTVRNKALQTRVQAALTRLGERRGWPPGAVLELTVDDHGLDSAARRSWDLGDCTATVTIIGQKAALTFARGPVLMRSLPADVKDEHADVLAEAKALVKRINTSLAVELSRVEGLLSEGRGWAYRQWVDRYLEQPITATYGRRLIWQSSADGLAWSDGLPERHGDEWVLAGADGSVIGVTDRIVRLWHPLLANAANVAGWRDHVTQTGLQQPFKQAFREVYRLTPADEQTGTHSNRFAGHILRYRQASALMRARGWQATYLGLWDGGRDSEATKSFGGGAWRASFRHDLVRDGMDGVDVELCSTGRVRFDRGDGPGWVIAPLADVPPLVLSEALRDVDLFVGVASVAADETWIDRGELEVRAT